MASKTETIKSNNLRETNTPLNPNTVKDQVEQDYNPAETARQRLERLKKEAAAVEAEVKAEEQGELNEVLRPRIDDLIYEVERMTGKTCRNFNVKYQQPGDGDVPVVVKLEQGKAGLVIAFRVVKPRQRES